MQNSGDYLQIFSTILVGHVSVIVVESLSLSELMEVSLTET